MSSEEWRDLWTRMRRRAIRALDVLSILVLDAVILLCGYGVIWLVDAATLGENAFFLVAKNISHGAFILLYLVLVVYDLWEFMRQP